MIKAVIFDLNGVIIQRQWPQAEPGMIELVKELRAKGIKTAVLSNLWIGTAPEARGSDWAQHFDVLGLSGEIKASKPEPASYLAVVGQLGCRPEDALFIDDLPGHIAGALAACLQAHLFVGEAELRQFLSSVLG